MRYIFLFYLMLFSVGQIFSQIGVRAGLNIATISYEGEMEGLEFSPIVGMNFGVLYEFQLSERIGIQPEIHFIQKGGKADVEFDPVTITDKYSYIELALLGKYNVIDFGENGWGYLGVSPHLAYAIRGVRKYDYQGEQMTEKINFEYEEIERVDYGVGLVMGASLGNFFVDARYNIGFGNLSEFEYDPKFFHRGILIGGGYQF